MTETEHNKRIKEIAHQIAGESIIITFHPHPRKIISSIPGEIKQLTCLDERIQLLEKANIDHLVVINFDYLFSNLTAGEYVQDFLVAHFHPHTIIVGYDHHFGKGRTGNFDLLVAEMLYAFHSGYSEKTDSTEHNP